MNTKQVCVSTSYEIFTENMFFVNRSIIHLNHTRRISRVRLQSSYYILTSVNEPFVYTLFVHVWLYIDAY